MRILIVDDSKERHEGFHNALASGHSLTHCLGYHTAVLAMLKEEPFDLVLLDHDLGDFEDTKDNSILPGVYGHSYYTGLDVAIRLAFIYREAEKRPKVIVHSHNPDGADRIKAHLKEAGFTVIVHPYDIGKG